MSLPEAFISQITHLLGDEAEAFFAALADQAPVSIRINTSKSITANHFNCSELWDDSVPWCSSGKYLNVRPAFTFDPLLHAGCYYVQEASSMFVEQAIKRAVELSDNERVPIKMLDLCAAPGGKSTLALSVLPEGSLLVANELIRTRANILVENLIKWGNSNLVVTQSDSSSFSGLTNLFDIVLTDVPCSGEGMFRKDPNAIDEWSENAVKLCALRQREIVERCWPALKPGGFLIYCTCTYNTTENEENIDWICRTLGAEAVNIPLHESWGISGSKSEILKSPVYRFFPHKVKGEGFFLALLKKNGKDFSYNSEVKDSKTKTDKRESKQKQIITEEFRNLIKNPERFEFSFDRLGRIMAFEKRFKSCLSQLETTLHIIHKGVTIGEIKGNDLLPDCSLALSNALDLNSVRSFELDIYQAICYLRRESLVLPESCDKGWILMTYHNHPLGWMKNIGSRANNSWPNEWRIRTSNPYKLD